MLKMRQKWMRPSLPSSIYSPGGHVVRRAAVLRADLDDAAVLSRGLDQLLPFPAVVAQRLLHVDVLARLAAPERGRHVPMVGRGDDHGVDRLVVEHLAEILHAAGGLAALLAGDQFGPRGERVAVDVAE